MASAGVIEGEETEPIPPEALDTVVEVDDYPEEPQSRGSHIETPDKPPKGDATSKPPNVGEWQDFFARIVIKSLLEGYTAWVFRDFEDEISPAEWARITLGKDDLHEMAAPFASLADRSKFARKHGRTIVAAADSYEAIIALGIWMRRVNKIAAKHRKEKAPVVNLAGKRAANNGHDRENEQPRPDSHGNDGGGFSVYNPGTG